MTMTAMAMPTTPTRLTRPATSTATALAAAPAHMTHVHRPSPAKTAATPPPRPPTQPQGRPPAQPHQPPAPAPATPPRHAGPRNNTAPPTPPGPCWGAHNGCSAMVKPHFTFCYDCNSLNPRTWLCPDCRLENAGYRCRTLRCQRNRKDGRAAASLCRRAILIKAGG